MKRFILAVTGLVAILLSHGAAATPATLLSETFDGVTSGYSGSDPRRFGIPDISNFGADNDWFGARFEAPDNGTPAHDVGVQQYGGSSNGSPVGIAEDDGGLLISFDASMYTDITLTFDWRTFSAGSYDRLVVGYFVGDLAAGHPIGFVNGQIDLRPTSHGGPADGVWNWEGGGWTELLRAGPNNNFSTATFDLAAAAGESEVWLAFWLDGGEGDFAKIDNIRVTGETAVIPVPAAVWLMASGLLGLGALRRRS
ncbi:MAG: VPLPA-CTERM sorting domain-containing protein [Gammaproteobacteria bacterium]|nr:VPLPA-CTERM sorting domain-containing protein [Gammaproteobacteria bacterium]NNM20292.1 VPLPA-CTERM sorting domain-containing protein [Gammaproteobacteria bacterium]